MAWLTDNYMRWRVTRMRTEGLPALGVGISFRPELQGELFMERQQTDFLEIVTDHYMDAPPSKLEALTRLEAHFPIYHMA